MQRFVKFTGLSARILHTARNLLAGLWALPCTSIGLVLGALLLVLGGRARRVGRVLEIAASGPLRSAAWPFSAITLGHVVLGTSRAELDRLRAHERVHVRQYEVWGPLFLLAYPAASLVALCKGRCAYAGNWFEQQAYAADPSHALYLDEPQPATDPAPSKPAPCLGHLDAKPLDENPPHD